VIAVAFSRAVNGLRTYGMCIGKFEDTALSCWRLRIRIKDRLHT
jgi:hypothetical protein